MKLLKLLSSLAFAAAALVSVNTSAATTTTLVEVTCGWSLVFNGSTSPGGSRSVYVCFNSGHEALAQRSIGSGTDGVCSLSASTGYQVSGTCRSPGRIYRIVTTQTCQNTTQVVASCNWNLVYNGSTSPGGKREVYLCQDSARTTLAERQIGSGTDTVCSLNASTGYQVSGTCRSPSPVYKVTTTTVPCP